MLLESEVIFPPEMEGIPVVESEGMPPAKEDMVREGMVPVKIGMLVEPPVKEGMLEDREGMLEEKEGIFPKEGIPAKDGKPENGRLLEIEADDGYRIEA